MQNSSLFTGQQDASYSVACSSGVPFIEQLIKALRILSAGDGSSLGHHVCPC
jgi:hypothetical protein